MANFALSHQFVNTKFKIPYQVSLNAPSTHQSMNVSWFETIITSLVWITMYILTTYQFERDWKKSKYICQNVWKWSFYFLSYIFNNDNIFITSKLFFTYELRTVLEQEFDMTHIEGDIHS